MKDQLVLSGLGYKLISINLSKFEVSFKHLLLDWIRKSPNTLIVSVDNLYKRTHKIKIIITDYKYKDLKTSIHKIVCEELHPILVINDNYQLTTRNISDYKTKTIRLLDCHIHNTNSITHS